MGFFRKLFGRKTPAPKAATKMPPINEDWRIGDVALCILGEGECWSRQGAGPRDGPRDGPRGGERCIVVEVGRGIDCNSGMPGWWLRLAGHSSIYAAIGFRKLPPETFEEPRVRHVKTPVEG